MEDPPDPVVIPESSVRRPTVGGDNVVDAHILGLDYGALTNVLGLAMKLGLTTHLLESMATTEPRVGSDLS